VNLKHWLFPAETRYLPGHRWINIGLRTLHLVGVAGLGAGFLYAAADEQWRLYLQLALGSGLALSLLYLYSNATWLLQLWGQAILLKLALLGVMPLFPDRRLPLLLAVVVISGLISHAPASVRCHSFWPKRQLVKISE